MLPSIKTGVATIVFSPSTAALGSDDDSDDGEGVQPLQQLPRTSEVPLAGYSAGSGTAGGKPSRTEPMARPSVQQQLQSLDSIGVSGTSGTASHPPKSTQPSLAPADSTACRPSSELVERVSSSVSQSSDSAALLPTGAAAPAPAAGEQSASTASAVARDTAVASPTKDRGDGSRSPGSYFVIGDGGDGDNFDGSEDDGDEIYGRRDNGGYVGGSSTRRHRQRSSSAEGLLNSGYDSDCNADEVEDADAELGRRSSSDSSEQRWQEQLQQLPQRGRRADSSSNLLLLATADDDEEPLAVRENHFGNAEDFRSLADIERTIDRVKLSVLGLPVDSPQRPLLVEQLVALRLRRDELRDGALSSASALGDSRAAGSGGASGIADASTKSVVGHTLCKYQAFPALGGSGERCCEACRAVIWGVLQSWYGCAACPVVCHERCLGALRRPCGAFAATAVAAGSGGGRSGGTQQQHKQQQQHLPAAICPDVGLAAQGFCCFECRAPLAYCRTPELEPRQCDVTGRYYCAACHWGDVAVSPARVLHNWDFEPRPVCRLTKHRLAAAWRRWLVRPRDLNARLFNFVEELSVARRLREEILQMKTYFAACERARRDKLLLRLSERQHFVDGADAYTLCDLVDLAHDVLLPELVAVHATFTRHIKVECEACRGKGFLCELCDNRKDVLFAFDSGLAAQCAVCQGVFHRVCFAKCDSPCPRCERRSRRTAGGGSSNGVATVAK